MSVDVSELASVIMPECVTPQQWLDMATTTYRSGEKRLLLTLLEESIRDYLQNGQTSRYGKKDRFETAERWILDTHIPMECPMRGGQMVSMFSFDRACTELGIEPGWLRAGIKAAKANGMKKLSQVKRQVRNRSTRVVEA